MADRSACRTTVSMNCDTTVNYNQGCGTQDTQPISYGKGFNSIGGGIYALARSKQDGIKVWFRPRSWATPSKAQWNEDTVTPDSWGPPTAYFPTGSNCNYEQHFNAHMLIFDLTFCVRGSSLLHLMKECTHFVASRAIGPVLLRPGEQAVAPP